MGYVSYPEAIKHLESLPTTDAIADELVSMGVKGRALPAPEAKYVCALAEYFVLATGRRPGVSYSIDQNGDVFCGGVAEVDLGSPVSHHLSRKVACLAWEFDRGLRPKLELEREN